MVLKESGEMYLETILILSNKGKHVRSIDVAEERGFSKPSVSRAVGQLKEAGYILVDPSGYLILTDLGRSVAEKIYERHNVLSSFLMAIGVSEETAIDDACRAEHVISDETLEAVKAHLETLQ